jgi:NitT/TauT family transport system substrate-binding protein
VKNFLLALGLAVSAALVGCTSQPAPSSGGSATGGTAPSKVRFMVANPVINLGHTQLAVAQQKGYYKDAGVDVEYLTSDGTVATVQALAAGGTDMGQIDTLSLDAAIAQGVNEVEAVCSYVANNIYYLAVPESSSIRQLSDLRGKKFGVSSLGTGVYYNAKVMLQQAGLDPDKDAEFITIAEPPAQLDALNKGTIDALSIIDVSIATFQNQGAQLRTFQPSGPMQWQWNVVGARKSFVQDHPDAVAATCRAIQQAEVYVVASPKAALAQFKAWGGDVGTTPDAQSMNIINYRAQAGFKTYAEGNQKWGWMNVDEMDDLANLYQQLGLLKAPISAKPAYSIALLDKMQPDTAKAKAQADADGK